MRYALPQPFRDLEHTADVGVEVEGDSAEEALARLVLAQSALLSGGGAVAVAREERLVVPPGDLVAMAIGFLREALFRFATRRELAGSAEVVRLDPSGGGELALGVGPFDPVAHAEGVDLKAVTWHLASFGVEGGRWRARVVFDI